MGVNLDNFETDDMQSTPSQTEDSAERGHAEQDSATQDPKTYGSLGESEELDSTAGDIADEGTGHRG